MSGIVVVSRTSLDCIQAAELIWAEATGARDGDPYVPGAQPLRPVIANVINQSSAAVLLTALGPDKNPLAFAALDQTGLARAELMYFGVTPRAWGQGIATLLLGELPRALRSVGVSRAELWVYEDNEPAVRVYEKLGWQPAGTARIHPRSGKRELRYGLDVPATGDHR